MVTDAQVRKLMTELGKHGNLSRAAMKADMDRKTARRYRDLGVEPSSAKPERAWRTRPDPFAEDWPEIVAKLEVADGLDAKTLFEDLIARRPGRYEPGQLRTLQRRVREWRALNGPDKRVFFAQEHRPGEAMQTDFTVGDELGVTIAAEPLAHRLCHAVLPYSNWGWATVCRSESMAALKRGVHAALRQLGGAPEWHQTDNSTAATHSLKTGKRGFNDDYAKWIAHLGMKPRTTAVGEKEQNGDVEALNGALKRRIEQHLLVRGSRDFASVEQYEGFVQDVLRAANQLRETRLAEERPRFRPLPATWYPEYTEEQVWVTPWSTIRVRQNTYSVPSRLIGERVRVRVFDDLLEIWYAGQRTEVVERLHGRHGHRIDYRHVIWSLVKRPGAFARYRYREDLFPSLTFRRAYDALREGRNERLADIEYVRILHLAASTSQVEVEAALKRTLGAGEALDARALGDHARTRNAPPPVAIPAPDLSSYDALLALVAK